ncbi:MAG: MFS transporter [Patescibacteria group bacterium]
MAVIFILYDIIGSVATNRAMINQSRTTIAVVIGNRAFRALWFAQICSQLSINMMLFLLGLVVYQATTSNTAVSGLFLAFGIPAVIFGAVAGVAVDRLDRKKVLFLCDLLRALLVAGLFLLSHNVVLVYLLVFLNALVTQFYVPAEAPTIPRLVKGGELVTANSLFSFTYYSSMALGFILAGPVLRLLGSRGALLFLSSLFLLAATSVSRLPSQKDTVTRRFTDLLRYDILSIFRKVWRDLIAGWAYLLSMPKLLDALLLLTGTQVIVAVLGTLGPGFADRVLQIDVRDASVVVIGPVVAGILLGALWVGNFGFRLSPQKLIRTGIVGAGIFLMLISLTVRLKRVAVFAWLFHDWVIFPLEILLFFLLGVANSLLDVPANSVLQKESAGEMRGRVYGILAAAVGGIGVLPVMAGGLLADSFGVGKVIFVLGVLVSLYGLYRVRHKI